MSISTPPAGLEPAITSTSGRRSPPGHEGVVQSSRLDLNQRPPRCERGGHSGPPHGTKRESGRQESNPPRTAYQTVASPPGPRPELERPVWDSNPSTSARQAGRFTRCVTGQGKNVRRESQQRRKESNLRRGFWRPAAHPGARPCSSSGRAGNGTCKGSLPFPPYSFLLSSVPGAGVGPTPAGSEPAVLPLDDPGKRQ